MEVDCLPVLFPRPGVFFIPFFLNILLIFFILSLFKSKKSQFQEQKVLPQPAKSSRETRRGDATLPSAAAYHPSFPSQKYTWPVVFLTPTYVAPVLFYHLPLSVPPLMPLLHRFWRRSLLSRYGTILAALVHSPASTSTPSISQPAMADTPSFDLFGELFLAIFFRVF